MFLQGCSLDSVDIENQYQLNPQGQLNFKAGRYTYTLYFSGEFITLSPTDLTQQTEETTGSGVVHHIIMQMMNIFKVNSVEHFFLLSSFGIIMVCFIHRNVSDE